MKKIVTLFTCLVSTLFCFSQYYEEINIDVFTIANNGDLYLCADDENLLGVIIHGEPNCANPTWNWYYNYPSYETIHADSIVILNNHEEQCLEYGYIGCDITTGFNIYYVHTLQYEQPITNPIVWKRLSESAHLLAPWNSAPCYTTWPNKMFLWSTGEEAKHIVVTNPGTYSVIFNHPCGSATYSVEVRDNVELYRATVDLRTNKNKVTWLATPEQTEYITEVKVYRDGNLVGTAPYANGYFLDAIGSDAAARTYQILGVSVEGEDCPIASYQKGTIHTTYYLDVNNDLNMTWNAPYIQEETEGQLTGYQIYKYNPATEELTLIDEVNTTITNYTCSANAFVGGRAILAATFDRVSRPSGGDGQRPEGADEVETRSFSNLSENMFTVVEQNDVADFSVYPNPANGAFTVEGAKEVTVYNTLGQVVATSRSEEGTHTFTLPLGIYFVKAEGGMVKKVVVE